MATVVELPRLSDTMEEGVVAKWRIAPGDKVKRGQIIAEIETDKATMEFESFDAGVVLQLVAQEGDTLPLGAPIAVFGKKGEDPKSALDSFGGSTPEAGSDPAPAAAAPAVPDPAPAVPDPAPAVAVPAPAAAAAPVEPVKLDPSEGRIPASPLARRLAREKGIELSAIVGSGPRGRVVKADVDAATPGAAPVVAVNFSAEIDEYGRPYASKADTSVRLSQMRKAIVRTMTESKTTIPHFYLTVDVDMDRAAKMRGEYNLAVEGTKVSFNDLVVAAVAKSLREYPHINAHYTAEGIVQSGDIHVGIAVAVDDGLIVPVVRHAEQKSLKALSLEVRDLGKRAKKKALKPNEMTGSTITVSNLGMFGIEEFSAVINPGEGAILAVGAVEDRVVAVDGQPVVRKRMKATMSCDHRVIDGATGAQWLVAVKDYLENPMKIFT